MKTLIVYKSCTGFTKRYAKYMGEKTGADVIDLKSVDEKTLLGYDTLVYGGGFYAGSLNGLKKAKSLYEKSGIKNLIVFAVGAMPPDSPLLKDTWARNLNGAESEKIPHFYLLGGLDYDHMKLIHRIMMKTAITGIQCAKNRDPLAEQFLQVTEKSFDGFDPCYADPVIACILSLKG